MLSTKTPSRLDGKRGSLFRDPILLTLTNVSVDRTAGTHQSGRYVIVSNRGHESITIFRVKQGRGAKGRAVRGTLSQVGFFHTRGETPRHFQVSSGFCSYFNNCIVEAFFSRCRSHHRQFDHSGQFLIVANQDTDTIAVFSFSLASGEIRYTGNEYRIPSPNFVCEYLSTVLARRCGA